MSRATIDTLSKRINSNKNEISVLKQKSKKRTPRDPLYCGTFAIKIYKPRIEPCLDSKVILTDSTFQYVEIFLRKNTDSKNKAYFYWQQAKNFFDATNNLNIIAKPLTAYYCFLNATKALLEFKGINYDTSHGVSGVALKGHINIKNEKIKFHPKGVLSGLCFYLNEKISTTEEYTLKDIFYNLPFVHRAYQSTYKQQAELFIPILNPRIVHDKKNKKCWLEIQLEAEHSNKKVLTDLQGYSLDNAYNNDEFFTLRRDKKIDWVAPRNIPNEAQKDKLLNYIKNRRAELTYIYSPNNLWYVKRKTLASKSLISHSTLPLTYAAMHRLSELARYEPSTLQTHLEKEASWLISEFIEKSLIQFIDEISCEITGREFRTTGFRS